MRAMKRAVLTLILVCALQAVPAWSVELTPSNFVMPTSPGELFSFDFIISSPDPVGIDAGAFKSTINVDIAGLIFDVGNSEAVSTDPGYWIFGNSVGAYAEDLTGNNYAFSDNPDNPAIEALYNGDVMARYAFVWDGTVDDYTFTLDSGITNSYVLLDDFVSREALQLPTLENSFTVHIPEPATLMLFALGSIVLLKKRSR